MPRRLLATAALALSAACLRAAPDVPPAAPPTPTPAPAAADPSTLLSRRFPEAKKLRWATAWTPDLVAAVAGEDNGASLIWADRRNAEPLATTMESTLTLAGTPTGLSALDLDGDGVNDLVVWLSVPVSAAKPAHQEVVTVRGSGTPRAELGAHRIALLLRDTDGPAAVQAMVPRLREYLPPSEAGSTESLVLRLDLATDEQLRSLLAPAGISICKSATGNARPHGHACERFASAQITKAVLDRIVSTTGYFGDWADSAARPGREDQVRLQRGVDCKVGGPGQPATRTVCTADLSGPGYSVWVFEGLGSDRRLREVDAVTYE